MTSIQHVDWMRSQIKFHLDIFFLWLSLRHVPSKSELITCRWTCLVQPLLFCFVISAVNVGCKTLEKKPILPCFSSYFWLHFLSVPFEKVLANSSRVDATATICFLHFRCFVLREAVGCNAFISSVCLTRNRQKLRSKVNGWLWAARRVNDFGYSENKKSFTGSIQTCTNLIECWLTPFLSDETDVVPRASVTLSPNGRHLTGTFS